MWLTVSGYTIQPSRDWEVARHTLLSQKAESKRDRERQRDRQRWERETERHTESDDRDTETERDICGQR